MSFKAGSEPDFHGIIPRPDGEVKQIFRKPKKTILPRPTPPLVIARRFCTEFAFAPTQESRSLIALIFPAIYME